MNITFSVDLDLNNRADSEFLEWYNDNSNKYLLKDALVVGGFIVKHGLNKIFINDTKDKSLLKYTAELNSLNEILNHTIKTYEEQIECIKTQKDEFYGDQIKMMKERIVQLHEGNKDLIQTQVDLVSREYIGRCEAMQQQIQELKCELDNYRQTDYEKIRLKECLKQKDNEIAILRSNNIVKGNLGEELVKNIISKWFCDLEILDMSGQGSMSDIHLVNKNDQRIVIECKNKANIALTDIDKSMRDIETLKETYSNKFGAYIFISIKSYNIPRKGEFCFEIINNIPVIWFGVDFENHPDLSEKEFVNVVKIMISMIKVLEDKGDLDKDTFIMKIKDIMKNIAEQKKTIGSLNTTLATMKIHVDKISTNTNDIYNDLKNMIGDHIENDIHECRKCKKTFKTIGGYERHIKSCNKPNT